MKFFKFPSIERFHHIKKDAEKRPHLYPAKIKYKSKVKLHGTNAAVVLNSLFNIQQDQNAPSVYAQKRTSTITPETDNFGFASWVEEHKDTFHKWQRHVHNLGFHNEEVIVHGEWCGAGVQKNVALAQVANKFFAIFAVEVENHIIIDPVVIKETLGIGPEDVVEQSIFVLPYYSSTQINIFEDVTLGHIIDEINNQVDKIDQCDPWVKKTFGVEGHGEGLVFYPVNSELHDRMHMIDREVFSRLTFKAKGQKHEVVKTKRKAVELTPEQVETQNKFVEMFVTENRLNQIVQQACNNDFDIRQTGSFLKAFCQDVHKESKDELEASGYEWKDVIKPVQKAAQKWYIKECKKLGG